MLIYSKDRLLDIFKNFDRFFIELSISYGYIRTDYADKTVTYYVHGNTNTKVINDWNIENVVSYISDMEKIIEIQGDDFMSIK